MTRLLVLATLAALTATAHAQPSETPPTELAPLPDRVTHYRAYTLTADALSLGMFAGGMLAEGPGGRDTTASADLMGIGLVGGFFATPIVHLAKGHPGRALVSFLLRDGLASLGMLIGVATDDCTPDEWFCGLDRIGPGILGGLVVASVIDAATLTEERERAPSWTPVVSARPGGGTVGFAATF